MIPSTLRRTHAARASAERDGARHTIGIPL
jgi:hypothetical protein